MTKRVLLSLSIQTQQKVMILKYKEYSSMLFSRQLSLELLSWKSWVSSKLIQDLDYSLIQLDNALLIVFHLQLSFVLGWDFSVFYTELWEWEFQKEIMELRQQSLILSLNIHSRLTEIPLETMHHQFIHTGTLKPTTKNKHLSWGA